MKVSEVLRLKLEINSRKSKVVKATESEFLSFTFTGKKIRWTQKCLDQFKYKILKLTSRSWGVSMAHRLRKLVEYVRGWMGYFRLSDITGQSPSWINGYVGEFVAVS